jgi:hypothetical protein
MFEFIEYLNDVGVGGAFVLTIVAVMYLKPVWLALIAKQKDKKMNRKKKKQQ